MAKKKNNNRQQNNMSKPAATEEGLTLKDQLNQDVLNKLKLAKQSLVEEEKQKEEEKEAKAIFDRKQREKNMSFEELLNQYGDKGSKF